MIGDGIEVRVLRNGLEGVRLGITAPAHIVVHRQEVYEAIRAANTSAATGVSSHQTLIARLRRQIGGP
jgi:carbon storage regulator